MKKTFTKFPSLLFMLFAMPSMSYAAEWTEVNSATSLQEAIDGQKENIRLVADFETSYVSGLRVGHDMTLDLNGHKVTMCKSGLAILGHSNTTITDLSGTDNGELITTGNASLIFINNEGSFTLKAGTLTTTGQGTALEVYKYINNIRIEGGRINAARRGYAVLNKGYITMTGGTIVGADRGCEPVQNIIDGEFTMKGGAVYAGNNSVMNCFDNVYWTDGIEEERGRTILPEGVTDGGAIVLDEKWAIPGTYYLNYHLPEGCEISPNVTHFYNADSEVTLPECNYRDNKPFAGWCAVPDSDENLFTAITDANKGNYQLYPVWKYLDIPESVSTDLIPESITPDMSEKHTELKDFVLHMGEGYYYENETVENYGGLYKLVTGECVATVTSISIDWDGNISLSLDNTITANGDYELRIPAASFGNDDWFYDDMVDGRCNPDLFYRYKVYNAPTEPTKCESNPANGSTVEALEEIVLTFTDEENVLQNYDLVALLTNESGETVCEIEPFDIRHIEGTPDNTLLLTLPEKVTAPGTYTLTFPLAFFSFDWWERDSSEIKLSWTIAKPGVGLEQIEAEGSASYIIYDMSGRRVSPGEVSNGIYIINGRKVAVTRR